MIYNIDERKNTTVIAGALGSYTQQCKENNCKNDAKRFQSIPRNLSDR